MKAYKFKIPLYNWRVTIIKAGKSDSSKDLKKALKNANCFKAVIREELSRFENNKRQDTYSGLHAYNATQRESVIVLNNITKKRDLLKVLSHELDHARFTICEYLNLTDNESQAYLMGYLCKKAIPKFYR